MFTLRAKGLLLGLCLLSLFPNAESRAEANSSQTPVRQLEILPLEYDSQGAILKIRLKAEQRCVFGDLNAISLDLASIQPGATKSAKLILSIESNDKVLASADLLSVGQTQSDGDYGAEFRLATMVKPALVGLYLCLDQQGTGSCREKPVKSFAHSMERYRLKRIRSSDWAMLNNSKALFSGNPADKVYFFKPLIIETGSVQFFPAQMTADDYRSLSGFFSGVNSSADIASLQRLGVTLGSLPLGILDRELVISLPIYSPKKCSVSN